MMRETAYRIGLQGLIVKAYQSDNAATVKALLLKALRLLGVSFANGKKS